MKMPKLVVLGASAGGVTAIQHLLSRLPAEFRIPLVVVQHLPADAQIDPALVFSGAANSARKILEATDKMSLMPSSVYFAPPGYHLLLERDLSVSLSQDELVHFARPSIDVTFESAADAFGDEACGILLTGANADGASGLQEMHAAGAITFVQDPTEAESRAMPAAALALFKPSFVGTIEAIAGKLLTIARGELI